jgi:hypothetical protein
MFAALACWLWSCQSHSQPEVSAKTNELAPSQPAEPVAPSPAPTTDVTTNSAAQPTATPATPSQRPTYPRPGWSEIVLEDELPICVFPDYTARNAAPFIDQVKAQTLRAGSRLVFGAFAPACINPACDDAPTLQCWIDREGNTLVVHTRYFGYHKDGAKCTDDCKRVIAGCETSELAAGSYTVRHGQRAFKLRVPGVLRSPCWYPHQRPKAWQ